MAIEEQQRHDRVATPVEVESVGAAARDARQNSLQIHLGDNTTITPVGSLDVTSVHRLPAIGNGVGTYFGGVSSTQSAYPSALSTTARTSLFGMRADVKLNDASILGYLEMDFLGSVVSAVDGVHSAFTVGNSLHPRLYWVDVRKSRFEVLAGQSWSLLTPNRTGLSALPEDLYYSQLVDTNYQVGLVWSRTPQVRAIFHAAKSLAMGVSMESPEQYLGGFGLTTFRPSIQGATDSSTGAVTIRGGNPVPDFVGKIAWDPSTRRKHHHVEVAGLARSFKYPTYRAIGETHGFGLALNANLEIVRNLRFITNNFVSNGGGRFIGRLAPDFVLLPGGISPVRADATTNGFEYRAGRSLFYGYWGGVYIGKDAYNDIRNGGMGYGYRGSIDHNRFIQEGSAGWTRTLWRDSRFGALQFLAQYSLASRQAWWITSDKSISPHAVTLFFDLRYVLPGQGVE